MPSIATSEYLIQKLKEQLSEENRSTFTVRDLINCSSLSRSTIYRNFPGGMIDLYKETFQREVVDVIVNKSLDWNQAVERFVDYIADHKTLCINLYRLSSHEQRRIHTKELIKYFFAEFLKKQYNHKKVLQILEKYRDEVDFLAGGLSYQLETWFKDDLRTSPEAIISKLRFCYQLVLDTI